MLNRVRAHAYCTLVVALLLGPSATAEQQVAVTEGTATFNVFLRSTPIGFEQVDVTRGSTGWIIRSRGDLSPPIDFRNQQFELEYDEQWRPLSLSIVGTRSSARFSLGTTFSVDGANTELEVAGQRQRVSHTMRRDAVVLPDYFFWGLRGAGGPAGGH